MDSLEKLPCTLSASEKARKSDELSREVLHHKGLELEKSLTMKGLGEQIKASDRKISDLAEEIRNGIEYREVKCNTRRDFEQNRVVTFRLDTREVVSSRPMQAGERQAEMFAKPSAQTTLTDQFAALSKPEPDAIEPLGPGDDDSDDDSDDDGESLEH